ncbi:MAG: preprotein translocase subunit SecG [Parcubacteria group bacterium Gr01-1014_20]|nr:MAG: preprotein translocase subunit SecG [Parcubacteria group bacterium Gr01-1014_20]
MITFFQIIISAAVITLILLQERSAGLSGIFGGDGGGLYQTRRGWEKMIFRGTVVLVIVFVGLTIFQLVY